MSGPYFESGYIDANYFDDPVSATLTATFTIQCEPVDPYFEAGYFEDGYFVGYAPSGTTQEGSASLNSAFTQSSSVGILKIALGIEMVMSNNVINITFTRTRTDSSTPQAQFTLSSTANKVLQTGATLSDSITLSNAITRVRTGSATFTATATHSTQISLFKGYEASIALEVSTQSDVGAIRQGSIQMSGAFTPTLTVSAIRNSTAILDSSATLLTTVSKFTGNEGTLEAIVNLSLQNNAIFVGNSSFNSSSVGGDQSNQSAQFTLSITADKIKQAEIQINSPYYEDGYLVDDYYENAGFDLACVATKVKEAEIQMDSPYYEDGYIDEDYFISNGFTLTATADDFIEAQATISAQATVSADVSRTRTGSATITTIITQSTSADRLRTTDVTVNSTVSITADISRTRSFSSTFTSTFTQSASVNEIQDFTSTPSSQFGISISTDRIRSHSATITAQSTLSCEFSEIETFEITTQSQFTQIADIEVIRGYQANLTNQVNQTADVSRSRDHSAQFTVAFTQSTDIERFGGSSADLQSQASLNVEIGTLESADITMSGVFTPVLTVNALRNMTAIMDVVATIQADVNVTTENQSNLQTEFTQTTQGDRIRYVDGSFTASFSVAQQQIETITPFEAQLSVQAQLQQQQIEKTVQGAANINFEAQIEYKTIELITPVEADLQTQFTQSTQGDRIRFITTTLASQTSFTPVIGNLQQGSAQLTGAFTPTMTVNVVRDVLSSMANSVTVQITAQKITDINSTQNSEFTQSTSETLFKSFGSNPVAVITLTIDTGIVFEVGFQTQSIIFNQDTPVVSNVSGSSGFDTAFTIPAVRPNAARPPLRFTALSDAELVTADKKFGTASLYVDGSGDRVVTYDKDANTYPYIDAPPGWDGATEYTIEFWFKPDWTYFNAVTSSLGQNYVIAQVQNIKFVLEHTGPTGVTPPDNEMLLQVQDGVTSRFGSTEITSSDGWIHVALTAHDTGLGGSSGYLHRLRLNGAKIGGGLYSDGAWYTADSQIESNASGVRILIGGVGSTDYAGWIDEFRLSSTARYPDEYPHPTVSLQTTAYGNDEDTLALLHFDGTNGSIDMVDDGGFATEFESTPSAQFSLSAEGIKVRIFEADFDVVASQLTAAVKTADFISVPDTQFVMTVDADYTVDNTAQLTAQATQTTTVLRIKQLESTQSSETSVTATVVKTVSAQTTEIVEFTQTTTAVKTANGVATIDSAMSFGITVSITRDTEQALIVQATMAITGARIRFADSTQTVQTTLSADVNSIGFAEADLSITTALEIDYTKIPEIQVTALSVASVDLTAGIERIRPFSAQISDAMSFTTLATANLVGVISMDTQASMSVSADRIRNTGGTFVTVATQTNDAVKTTDINSTFNINASLSAIAFELQVFDLIYTIPNESRINTVETETRLYTIRDENRLYTIEGD